MNDAVPVESQVKQQITNHLKANWVGWLVAVIALLVGSYANTYVRDRAKDEIILAGAVSMETYNLLKGEVNTLTAMVESLEEVNRQQDARLNQSIDRLDSVIDTMIRSAKNTQ